MCHLGFSYSEDRRVWHHTFIVLVMKHQCTFCMCILFLAKQHLHELVHMLNRTKREPGWHGQLMHQILWWIIHSKVSKTLAVTLVTEDRSMSAGDSRERTDYKWIHLLFSLTFSQSSQESNMEYTGENSFCSTVCHFLFLPPIFLLLRKRNNLCYCSLQLTNVNKHVR